MRVISVEQLKNKLEHNEDFLFLDVREPAEFAEANLGAQLIPLGQIAAMQIDDLEDYRDKEIVIHCRSGMRSMQACMLLEQYGFTNTVNVQGGIMAWLEAYGPMA
jgi:rhodanese-related sulfurtransferase